MDELQKEHRWQQTIHDRERRRQQQNDLRDLQDQLEDQHHHELQQLKDVYRTVSEVHTVVCKPMMRNMSSNEVAFTKALIKQRSLPSNKLLLGMPICGMHLLLCWRVSFWDMIWVHSWYLVFCIQEGTSSRHPISKINSTFQRQNHRKKWRRFGRNTDNSTMLTWPTTATTTTKRPQTPKDQLPAPADPVLSFSNFVQVLCKKFAMLPLKSLLQTKQRCLEGTQPTLHNPPTEGHQTTPAPPSAHTTSLQRTPSPKKRYYWKSWQHEAEEYTWHFALRGGQGNVAATMMDELYEVKD